MTRITVKTDAAEYAKKLELFAADLPRDAKAKLYGRMVAMQKRISKYPPQWRGTLPRNWFKSDRQRRKVMALVREGKVPYQRTGAYMDAWQIEKLSDGYRLETKGKRRDVAKYIGGNASGGEQAKIHQGRWAVASDVVEDEIKKLPREIQDVITLAARRRGLA